MPRLRGGKLTIRERKFLDSYIRNKGKSATAAALEAYDTKNRGTASQIAKHVLARPVVQKELNKILDSIGLTEEKIAEKWNEAIGTGWGVKAKHADALSSLKMVTRLRGMDTKSSAHLRVNIEQKAKDTPYDLLIQEYRQLKDITDKIIAEGEVVS